jgi:hypothetical protein
MNDHEINVRLESPDMVNFVLQCFLHDVPLSLEVPQGEVLRSEINRAAIAEVQASFLQRWL